jgi:hypothetical protein
MTFKAGDLIGYAYGAGGSEAGGGGAWDFGAYDTTYVNQVANQRRYVEGRMSQSLHTICPFDYFGDILKTRCTYCSGLPIKGSLPVPSAQRRNGTCSERRRVRGSRRRILVLPRQNSQWRLRPTTGFTSQESVGTEDNFGQLDMVRPRTDDHIALLRRRWPLVLSRNSGRGHGVGSRHRNWQLSKLFTGRRDCLLSLGWSPAVIPVLIQFRVAAERTSQPWPEREFELKLRPRCNICEPMAIPGGLVL